jgi:hypothetical protein
MLPSHMIARSCVRQARRAWRAPLRHSQAQQEQPRRRIAGAQAQDQVATQRRQFVAKRPDDPDRARHQRRQRQEVEP